MTFADLVSPPRGDSEPLRLLAHMEYQVRVMGLLYAAAIPQQASLVLPGSLDTWANSIRSLAPKLGCAQCTAHGLNVVDSIDAELAPGEPFRQIRNRVFHGGPIADDFDLLALRQLLAANSKSIVGLQEHGHVSEMTPFFLKQEGNQYAILNDYSSQVATYWPRNTAPVDVVAPAVLQALAALQIGASADKTLNAFALDIGRDLRGFAQSGSVDVLVDQPQPIVVSWDLRTSSGVTRRVDRFRVRIDGGREWVTHEGPRQYKAFLADVCSWNLLKARLLENLEEHIRGEEAVSEEIFGLAEPDLPTVISRVRFIGPAREAGVESILDAFDELVLSGADVYSGMTNLVTITGEAGAGKTHSLLQYAHASLQPRDDFAPIAIYMSSMGASAHNLQGLIDSRLESNLVIGRAGVYALCRAGLAVLIIDGFDEMLGFRTFDTPLVALRPVLDELHGRGTLILSARSSYAEGRLRRDAELQLAGDWRPAITPMNLSPWSSAELDTLIEAAGVEKASVLLPIEVQRLLVTPFFCLAYLAWAKSDQREHFLGFVVDRYLGREQGKLGSGSGTVIFDKDALSDIFCEVAELIFRGEGPQLAESELILAAESAQGRELSKVEARRLTSLCGLSAEWMEEERSFSFSHSALAEHFLARQIQRLPKSSSVSLLQSGPLSLLCAELLVTSEAPDVEAGRRVAKGIVDALQELVDQCDVDDASSLARTNLGRLWTVVYGELAGHRSLRGARLDELEVTVEGRVALRQVILQKLVLKAGVHVSLVDCDVQLLDISATTPAAVSVAGGRIAEVFTASELATGEAAVARAIGIAAAVEEHSEVDDYFAAKLQLTSRWPLVLGAKDYSPQEGDDRCTWTLRYGLSAWQRFLKEKVDSGEVELESITAGGRAKVRVRCVIAELPSQSRALGWRHTGA